MRADEEEERDYGEWEALDSETFLKGIAGAPTALNEVWPDWNDGVPSKFRRILSTASFFHEGNHHRSRFIYVTVELDWNEPHALETLREKYWLLPSVRNSDEWSGVYRIFTSASIPRCCGIDPTGTLYLGMAGASSAKWSILRTRLRSIAAREHHVFSYLSRIAERNFAWKDLWVQWAFTRELKNERGKEFAEAKRAEGLLLSCYNDAFGEFPPWNQRG